MGDGVVVPYRARVVLLFFAAAVIVGTLHSPAHARHNFSTLQSVEPRQAAAGESVTVRGFSYTDTVEIRFGALDGPVLTEVEPDANDDITAEVRIPPDAEPGRYILYAVQRDEDGDISRYPGQANVWVVGEGAPPVDEDTPEVEPRLAGLVVQEGPGLGSLLFVAMATAAVAAGAVLVTTWQRRRARAEEEAAS